MNYKPITNEQLDELEQNPLAIRFLKSYRQLLKEYGILQSEISELKDENNNLKNNIICLTNRDKPFDRLQSRVELLESQNNEITSKIKQLGLISVENNSLRQIVAKNERLKANNHLLSTINSLLSKLLILETNSTDLSEKVDEMRIIGDIEPVQEYSKSVHIQLQEKGFFNKK